MARRPLTRVLLIDDDEDDFILTRDLLGGTAKSRFSVDWAASMADGLLALERADHDVCLLDFRLGPEDGIDLLREAGRRSLRTPIILLTGQGDHELDVEAMAAGAADYLVKSQLEPVVLERAIRYAIERNRALAALRESEGRLDDILSALRDVVWSISPQDHGVVFFNPAAAVVYGRPVADLLKQPQSWRDAVHPDDRPRVDEFVERLGRVEVAEVEYRIVRADGQVRWLHSRGHPTRGGGGIATRIDGITTDVTERKQMQGQLLQAERMASVGTLAAGVAHEINNPLTYVIANLSLIAEQVPALRDNSAADSAASARLQELEDALGQARDGAERVRAIVRDLKSYSRVDEERRGPVDLRRVLDLSINMASNEIRHRARLVREYGDVPLVVANEARLGQVFLNLLVNAAQAMPEGNVAGNEIRVVTHGGAGAAVVEVRDTGTGIHPEVAKRMFDPFFTTKPIGVGTGLGLYVCHSIVAALGGEISAESSPGEGTVMRVTLPAYANGGTVAKKDQTPPDQPVRRSRILIVDDEAPLAQLLRRMLHKEHDVVVAVSAREALDMLLRGDRFDIVFCDLMMPDVTGMDLFEELQRERPGAEKRIVFMTGGAFTPRARSFLENVSNQRIEKPFDAKQVRRMVRDRLASSQG